ncbi:glycosyl hydrolase family 43 [Colletotrichum graminicola]|uniref:Glycosyl hydrolase family 43 n=1 Tax=Colletotrichum graminicola (strain M1.001 / M2 / FGSC 10212) TaxID=645133 RepID=E3Q925_COLGM|nr:glycosyl hydrolase family 43 [Colletotrichum graminicola M1.001]EFQ27539.1 glycosyl hydrolase family 43 [Colletotrichum graminicola M1.001]WDK13363.1 glycosyl hydrolase family 43 [Colletotrichum graminicola]
MAVLLTNAIFTADPSAHVFNNRVYVYPSHDRNSTVPVSNDGSDKYDMVDYHIFSTSSLNPYDPATDHGVALSVPDIPWVSKQLWAPDAAFQNNKYYLYFPARNKENLFQIGVAVSEKPEGPFTPDPEPIPGSFSIDPAVFFDNDGQGYMYFGGLWGGQLQCYQKDNKYDASWAGNLAPNGTGVYALGPRVAKINSNDMHHFDGEPQELQILDPETKKPLLADDQDRRFFEAPWMHKKGDTYYFSYSTGTTHYLVYATSKSPLGPFTYAGRILEPVVGWTTHHSILEYKDQWWLFFHDASLSNGTDYLRNVRFEPIFYDKDGKLTIVKPQAK